MRTQIIVILDSEIHYDKSPQGLLHPAKETGSKLHLKILNETKQQQQNTLMFICKRQGSMLTRESSCMKES